MTYPRGVINAKNNKSHIIIEMLSTLVMSDVLLRKLIFLVIVVSFICEVKQIFIKNKGV